jgi:hypothetical protein
VGVREARARLMAPGDRTCRGQRPRRAASCLGPRLHARRPDADVSA